jgi:hypothetical protein
MKAKLEQAIENPKMKAIQETAEDRHHQRRPAHPDHRRQNRPMFDSGGAVMKSTRATSCAKSARP